MATFIMLSGSASAKRNMLSVHPKLYMDGPKAAAANFLYEFRTPLQMPAIMIKETEGNSILDSFTASSRV